METLKGIGYRNRKSSSLSSHINFVKSSSHSKPSSSKQNESQTFKVKRSQVSNTKVKSNKTQSFITQRGKAHTRKAQPKHAYMYTRHNNHKHARQHIAPKNTAHCHYNCMTYSRLKRAIESILYYKTQGMFHTLGKHIILE